MPHDDGVVAKQPVGAEPEEHGAGYSSITGATTDAVALRLEQVGGAAGLVVAGDEDRQDAAALGREVAELEVLDVDPLRAERLRDPGEHARPVGDVHAEPLELARVGELAAPASDAGCRRPRAIQRAR